MPDLAEQIRARLDGWAPPTDDSNPPTQFVEVIDPGGQTPEQVEEWQRRWDEILGTAEGMSLQVLATAPRFYPGFEQMRAALLAALELHKPYEHHRIRCSHCTGHGVVNLDWPCPTVMTVAGALGIAIHDSRIEDDDAH